MPKPRTSGSGGTIAVVLNWNGADDTLRCLDALARCRPVPPRVLVVDNGSQDDSRERIRARYPDVWMIDSRENRGYAGGNNLGIRAALDAGATRVVLLNNDVEVEPDCLARLEAALDADPAIGVAGPIVLLTGGAGERRIWAAGGELKHRENISRLRGHGRVLNGRFTVDEDVDYVPGAVLMVRREVFDRVGLLDESFFCYMEDVEFGRRSVGAGFRNRLVAAAFASHAASASTGGGYTAARKYMNAVNSVHFLRRHGTPRAWLGFIVFDVLLFPAAFGMATLRGRPRAALAKLRGLIDGLCGVRVTPERVARYLRGKR